MSRFWQTLEGYFAQNAVAQAVDGDEIGRLSQLSGGTAPVTGIHLVPTLGVCPVAAGRFSELGVTGEEEFGQ